MVAVPSEELRIVLRMFVILFKTNFKFRNRSTCSKGPMKRAGKVCGDSQDLKSPGIRPPIGGPGWRHRPYTITQKMADQRQSDSYVVYTEILYGRNFCVW